MRKLLIALALILLLPTMALAAGTVTQTVDKIDDVRILTFTFTADSADGTIPSTAISAANLAKVNGYYIMAVITNPGTTAPTANYDIVINDEDGIDMMGGTLANRHTSTSEIVVPKLDTANNIYGPRLINGSFTLVITNNSVNSATGTVKLLLAR